MKAVVVEHLGEAGSLRDVPTPQPQTGEVLVRVSAAGVNPIDWKTRDGGRRKMPFVLGQDFAGIVVAVGPNTHRYALGDRIFGIARTHGSYAEFTIVPADDNAQPICKIPDDVGDADAAALPTAGLTALAAIDILNLRDGARIAVIGVTGGVGGFTAQIAHARGLYVIGAGHSGHEAAARDFGVDRYIAYDKDDIAAVLENDPVDAVIDLADDESRIKRLAKIIKPGGAIVSTIGSLDIEAWRNRSIAAHNLVMNQTPQSSHSGLRELARMIEEGTLHVAISAERALQDAAQALEASKSGSTEGKVILTVETGRI